MAVFNTEFVRQLSLTYDPSYTVEEPVVYRSTSGIGTKLVENAGRGFWERHEVTHHSFVRVVDTPPQSESGESAEPKDKDKDKKKKSTFFFFIFVFLYFCLRR